MKRKTISLLLCLLLTLFLFPMAVNAAACYTVTPYTGGLTFVGEATTDGTADYTAAITLKDGYDAPDYLTVWCGDTELNPGQYDYTVINEICTLTVKAGAITGDLAIVVGTKAELSQITAEATPVTLPYEDTFAAFTGTYFNFVKCYSISLRTGDNLLLSLGDIETGYITDCVFSIYRASSVAGGEPVLVIGQDIDNYYDYGELMLFTAEQDGTYYVIAEKYDWSFGKPANLIIEPLISSSVPLDFTKAEPPVPGAEVFWSWNAQEQTLTLKDGFAINAPAHDRPGILLPAGAAIAVEGQAELISQSTCIACLGDLTITLKPSARLAVKSIAGSSLLTANGGNLQICGGILDATTFDQDCIISSGGLTI